MSTNLHIDDIGNLILRDGKFGLCVSSQYATPPHYGGGRVGALSFYAYCAGDPVNCVDRDGECPAWAVSVPLCAVGGALIGGVIAAWNGGDARDVYAATAGGFVAGAIAGTGVGLLSEITIGGAAGVVAEISVSTGVGALSAGVGNAVEQLIGNGDVDPKEVGANAISGAVVGSVSSVFSKAVKPITDKIASEAGNAVKLSTTQQAEKSLIQQKKMELNLIQIAEIKGSCQKKRSANGRQQKVWRQARLKKKV